MTYKLKASGSFALSLQNACDYIEQVLYQEQAARNLAKTINEKALTLSGLLMHIRCVKESSERQVSEGSLSEISWSFTKLMKKPGTSPFTNASMPKATTSTNCK